MAARPEAVATRLCAGVALLLSLLQPMSAQAARPRFEGPRWQQHVQRWERLPPQRRQDILREQRRFRRLSPQQQRRLFEQYRRERR